MTKDEIKQTYSMTDIVRRYGLQPNRAGFIRCPFHQCDHTASLKIYKDNFYCYGCGAAGDIFKFVMLMDGVSFKDAFLELGGHYDRPETRIEARHRARDLVIAERERTRKEQERQEKLQEMHEIGDYVGRLVTLEKHLDPMSELWCYVQNELPVAYGKWLELWEEVNETGNKN